jgi:hypothetical protein
MMAKHCANMSSVRHQFQAPVLEEEPVEMPVGSEVCDICGTTSEDDFELNHVCHHPYREC